MERLHNNGLIVGKFMPLHNGHVFLVERALSQCDHVTILLFSDPDDPIDGAVRYEWLTTLFPHCTIVHHDQPLPRDESGYGHWQVWLDAINTVCPQSFAAVFSSEEYGERLAADVGAVHVLVDHARSSVPVSGTDIRRDPAAHAAYLPAIVNTYYENQN